MENKKKFLILGGGLIAVVAAVGLVVGLGQGDLFKGALTQIGVRPSIDKLTPLKPSATLNIDPEVEASSLGLSMSTELTTIEGTDSKTYSLMTDQKYVSNGSVSFDGQSLKLNIAKLKENNANGDFFFQLKEKASTPNNELILLPNDYTKLKPAVVESDPNFAANKYQQMSDPSLLDIVSNPVDSLTQKAPADLSATFDADAAINAAAPATTVESNYAITPSIDAVAAPITEFKSLDSNYAVTPSVNAVAPATELKAVDSNYSITPSANTVAPLNQYRLKTSALFNIAYAALPTDLSIEVTDNGFAKIIAKKYPNGIYKALLMKGSLELGKIPLVIDSNDCRNLGGFMFNPPDVVGGPDAAQMTATTQMIDYDDQTQFGPNVSNNYCGASLEQFGLQPGSTTFIFKLFPEGDATKANSNKINVNQDIEAFNGFLSYKAGGKMTFDFNKVDVGAAFGALEPGKNYTLQVFGPNNTEVSKTLTLSYTKPLVASICKSLNLTTDPVLVGDEVPLNKQVKLVTDAKDTLDQPYGPVVYEKKGAGVFIINVTNAASCPVPTNAAGVVTFEAPSSCKYSFLATNSTAGDYLKVKVKKDDSVAACSKSMTIAPVAASEGQSDQPSSFDVGLIPTSANETSVTPGKENAELASFVFRNISSEDKTISNLLIASEMDADSNGTFDIKEKQNGREFAMDQITDKLFVSNVPASTFFPQTNGETKLNGLNIVLPKGSSTTVTLKTVKIKTSEERPYVYQNPM
ncbi:hypothetical protein IT412_03135, partial [Candidatus Peregrinibacteria bacterium]|nr:hypothetical protein [Candidatus Peregrinibacteria bacterium]